MRCFLVALFASACSQVVISEHKLLPAKEERYIEWWNRPEEYYDDIYKRIAGATNFSCPSAQNVDEKQITAHSLPPERVKVIAALGDSLTAGFGAGAYKIEKINFENRGVSFSIGGDFSLDNMATLPNFIRKFNPSVEGASHKDEEPVHHLNVAVGGSIASDLLPQAKELLKRLENMSGVDIQNDWKVVSIFIGTNDLCRRCWNKNLTGAAFAAGVTEAIDYLRDNLPKTIVNVVPAFNVGTYRQTMEYSGDCTKLHQTICYCVNEKSVEEYQKITDELNSVYNTFLTNDSYQTDSFAVVVSDALNTLDLFSYEDSNKLILLAPDCFHFSTVAHDVAAKLIWNNLMEPKKMNEARKEKVDPLQPVALKCPDKKCPFIRTVKNSVHCLAQAEAPELPVDAQSWQTAYLPSMPSFPVTVMASMAVIGLMVLVLSRNFRRRKKQQAFDNAPLISRHSSMLVY